MFNTILLIIAAAMAAWNVYRLITRPDSVAVVTVLFWAVLLWRILSPLDWHISVLAGLLLLKVILAQRRHARMQGDVVLGRELQRADSRRNGKQREDADEDDEEEDADEDELLSKKESVTLKTAPVGRPLNVRFVTKEEHTFPTTSGEPLHIAIGEHSGTLALRSPQSPETDEALEEGYTPRIHAEFTYHDPAGQRWRCDESLWVGTILSLERVAGTDSPTHVQFWTDAPRELNHVFRERCLVAKHPVADDGRVRFPLQIGTRRVVVMTKYLSWKVDLALDTDERRIWVRVSELQEEVWDGDVFGPNGDAAEWKDIKQTPAFYYPVPVEDFLPGIGRNVGTKEWSDEESEEDGEDGNPTIFTTVET